MSFLPTILVTFVCTNPTMTDCKIYRSQWETEEACAVAAAEVGNRARIMALKESILFYCTDSNGLEDLPIDDLE